MNVKSIVSVISLINLIIISPFSVIILI